MRNKCVQMSLSDIYNDVSQSIEEHKPELIKLLEEHIDFADLIPPTFKYAFYHHYGRGHIYHLESFIRALTLQKLLGIPTDKLLITILETSRELSDFCGFNKVPDAAFDANGTPICPFDGTPFTYLGKSGGKKRSLRFKWVCHCSVKSGNTRKCICEHPCTDSTYGKCVYTYPDKDFRLYPGIPRDTAHWDNLYRHRVTIERTINLLKDTYALDSRYSHRSVSAKADTYLAAITQLFGVILADAIHKPELYKSIRKLIA